MIFYLDVALTFGKKKKDYNLHNTFLLHTAGLYVEIMLWHGDFLFTCRAAADEKLLTRRIPYFQSKTTEASSLKVWLFCYISSV